MKCEICNANEAVVHVKQVVNGDMKEMHVCESCAAEHGFDVHSPMTMTDFLFGMGMDRAKETPAVDKACPACHLKLSEFHKRTRLGCPECYVAFADELSPVLASMHRGVRHVGKVPGGERVAQEALDLQTALDEAVRKQEFEEAARLRDRINELKSTSRSREAG